MSILTYIDFPHLSSSDRKQMAEIEEQLRGESGRLPPESELRRRVEFLQASAPKVKERDRTDFFLAIVALLILGVALMVTEYNAFGIELAPNTEGIILGLAFVPIAFGALWFTLKFRSLPTSSKSAELELMLIKSVLNRRDLER